MRNMSLWQLLQAGRRAMRTANALEAYEPLMAHRVVLWLQATGGTGFYRGGTRHAARGTRHAARGTRHAARIQRVLRATARVTEHLRNI